MKIGIITWHKVNKYGTFWLCYAMQRYIEQRNHEAVLLDYTIKTSPKKNNDSMLSINIINKIYQYIRNLTPNRISNKSVYKKKLQTFTHYRKKYLSYGNICSESSDCDIVIIGSDQIFDCKYGYYDFQYGIGVPCENISAYAPSFGEMTSDMMKNEDHKLQIMNALNRFRILTVRDNNSRDIVYKLIDKLPPIVIDPVLLYGFNEEKNKWSKKLVNEPYMVIYTWGGFTTGDEFIKQIKKLAKRNKLKKVSIGDRRPWCDISFASATPIEFLMLFMHDNLVITNMFHGTCFSILFNRPFYSISMPHNKNKLDDLLIRFKLENQLIYNLEQIDELCIPNIDYKLVNNRIEEARKISSELFNKMLI